MGGGWGEDGGNELALYIWRGQGCAQMLGWRSGLTGLPTPLMVLCAASMCSPLLQPLVLHKWQLVFLYIVHHNFPQLHMHTVIFSPLQFLFINILLLEETSIQVQALQQRGPGPRFQLVSVSQEFTYDSASHLVPMNFSSLLLLLATIIIIIMLLIFLVISNAGGQGTAKFFGQ